MSRPLATRHSPLATHVACVWLPQLPLRVEVLRHPAWDGRPLVLGGGPGERKVVQLCSPEAEQAGIRPGLPLREVLSLCHEAIVLQPDPVRVSTVLDEVATALQQVSPHVEAAQEDLFLDLRGLEGVYGADGASERVGKLPLPLGEGRGEGEWRREDRATGRRGELPLPLGEGRGEGEWATLEQAIRQAVPPLLRPRIGIATGKFAASLAARVGTAHPSPSTHGPWPIAHGSEYPTRHSPLATHHSTSEYPARHSPLATRHSPYVPADQATQFLAPLPVANLPLEPDAVQRLETLGLRTIGDLAALPFSAVQAQLGPAGARAWRLAHGQDDEPLVPGRYVPRVQATLRFDAPLASLEAIVAALDQLLARVFADPVLQGRSIRQAHLRALLADDTSWERLATFPEALSTREAVRRALKARLELPKGLPPAAVEELCLELKGLSGEAARQPSLFVARARQEGQISEAGRQLRARYGRVPLYHVMEVEPWSRVPERRWALIACDL